MLVYNRYRSRRHGVSIVNHSGDTSGRQTYTKCCKNRHKLHDDDTRKPQTAKTTANSTATKGRQSYHELKCISNIDLNHTIVHHNQLSVLSQQKDFRAAVIVAY